MAKRFIPNLNRILIEKIVPPSKTSSGILLPESTSKGRKRGQLNCGKVVAVGPGKPTRDGRVIPVAFKEGDTVVLPLYDFGSKLNLGDGKDYVLYHDEYILGTLYD